MGFFNKKKEEKKTNLKQGAKVGLNKDDLFNVSGGVELHDDKDVTDRIANISNIGKNS